ncbi:MAG TPA: hypothetical protein VN442_18765 [Bryobacteraceae bacterium]|nr:hypothetical protein [Bryobacteraceae bacterium]
MTHPIRFGATMSPAAIRFFRVLAAAGGLTFLAGTVLAPERAWASLLMAGYLLTGFGLAGVVFVATQYASGAGWSTAFRRVPEAMAAILPFGAAALTAVLLAYPSLYPWTAHAPHPGFQQLWLNRPFFLVRAAIYIAVWVSFALLMVRTSRRQDVDGAVASTRRNVRLSVLFLAAFAVTFSLASFDWVMSLEPAWASTIFGIYNFAGMFSGGLALLIVLVIWMRYSGPLRDFVNEEHLHDLGKLLFAFSTFWMYIWFSQYMLIWYANIGEETAYYVARLRNAWGPLFLLNMSLNWAIPFAVLLPRAPKRSARSLGRVAAVVLAGRILDVYLMIAPPVYGANPKVGVWEVGMLAGAAGVLVLAFYRSARQAAPVPLKDPYLEESLRYRNA